MAPKKWWPRKIALMERLWRRSTGNGACLTAKSELIVRSSRREEENGDVPAQETIARCHCPNRLGLRSTWRATSSRGGSSSSIRNVTRVGAGRCGASAFGEGTALPQNSGESLQAGPVAGLRAMCPIRPVPGKPCVRENWAEAFPAASGIPVPGNGTERRGHLLSRISLARGNRNGLPTNPRNLPAPIWFQSNTGRSTPSPQSQSAEWWRNGGTWRPTQGKCVAKRKHSARKGIEK